jgi:hypothetical protein
MSRSKKLPVPIDPEVDRQNRLRATAIVDTINANLPVGAKKLVHIPREYVFKKSCDTQEVTVALHSCFELVGGVPNLVRWATDRPDQFYPLWAKLAANEKDNQSGVTINFSSAIPKNKLDSVTIDPSGRVLEFDDDEVPE